MSDKYLETARLALYALLIVLGFFIVNAWEKDHPKLVETQQTGVNTANTTERPMPALVAESHSPSKVTPAKDITQENIGQIITVNTDLIQAKIDTRGGDIVSLHLLHYPETLGSSTPYPLFTEENKIRYLAESGLLSSDGPDTGKSPAVYTAQQTHYELNPDQSSLNVILQWQNSQGLRVNKIYTFSRDSYDIGLKYELDNQSAATWQGQLYTQLARTDVPPVATSGLMNLATYFGAAVSSPEKRLEKITFADMQKQDLNQRIKSGWAAMVQHYFVSAWIPPQQETFNYYSKVTPNGLYVIGMLSQPITVAPANKITTQTKLYAGPAKATLMEKAAPGLQLTIDYGWFWFISILIFWLMQHIYDIVGNWGWAIVIVTILIKLVFYQLSAKSYRSMSALKRLQPRIEALKERFGDDKQKMTQAMMELYRQEKVNPMSGCLPILVQIPVFIALYWVLVESVELRQAPFILWIHDLSQRDPYYVLPVIMGITMFLQQRLSPPPADPMQAKVMMAMPIVFTFLFANFPAGLLLYWVVNNTLSFLQQWYVMHQIDKELSVKTKPA